MLRVLIVASVIALVQCRIAPGFCFHKRAKSDFNYQAFRGAWTEVTRYRGNDISRLNCVFYFINLLDSDTTFSLERQGYTIPLGTLVRETQLYDIDDPTVGRVTKDGEPDLVILDTDYDNYAIFYSCERLGFLQKQGPHFSRKMALRTDAPFISYDFLYVLTRNPTGTLDAASWRSVLKTLFFNGIRILPQRKSLREDCPGR